MFVLAWVRTFWQRIQPLLISLKRNFYQFGLAQLLLHCRRLLIFPGHGALVPSLLLQHRCSLVLATIPARRARPRLLMPVEDLDILHVSSAALEAMATLGRLRLRVLTRLD